MKRKVELWMSVLNILVMVMLSSGIAVAAGDDLTPLDSSLDQNDTGSVEYCVYGITPLNSTVIVNVDPVCKDTNGISGCQDVDILYPEEFSAEPLSNITTIEGSGCAQIEVTTDDAEGTYYFTVNGRIGEAEITSETGSGFTIPEMTTVGAIVALIGAGTFIYKKREV